MKKFLTAALVLAACSSEPQQIRATSQEIAQALRGMNVVSRDAVDLKGGSECVFVLTESGMEQGVSILERRNGRLSIFYNSPSWGGRRAENIYITDKGNDGKKEVEVKLTDGRRIYYLWDGDEYKEEDALKYHGVTGHEKIRDEVFYKDFDEDGTEEALVIYAHDFSSPFSAHKWNHGWTRFENSELAKIRQEYESAAKSGMDALALDEKKGEIREKLRHYARQ